MHFNILLENGIGINFEIKKNQNILNSSELFCSQNKSNTYYWEKSNTLLKFFLLTTNPTNLYFLGKLEECELFAAKNHTLATQGNTAASRALNSLDELKISLTRAQNSQEELSKRLNKQG